VRKTDVLTKEGVYFVFPFAMDQPQFRYEIQNGVVNPARDLMPEAGREWFFVQHWIGADQGGVTAAIIPVDAFLVTLGDIMRGKWPREFGQRPGTVFSQVMNNYYFTNYAASQGGDFTFRYVLTSGNDLAAAHLSRLGREEMSPLEVDQITSQDKAVNTPRPLATAQASFMHVDQPDVALVTWKVAEDDDGTILRYQEVAGKSAEVNTEIPLLDVKAAWTADALERNQGRSPPPRMASASPSNRSRSSLFVWRGRQTSSRIGGRSRIPQGSIAGQSEPQGLRRRPGG
jgi:hypothetical protein